MTDLLSFSAMLLSEAHFANFDPSLKVCATLTASNHHTRQKSSQNVSSPIQRAVVGSRHARL